jgi:DNA-cytosine methyltransferase
MRVLSVFDGISCAKVALDRVGIPVTEYLSSEIDPHAIKISQANHPDITRLGDIRHVFMSHLKAPIDLMIGGSPCQDLSIAKKNRQGLAGDRSGLFWEFVRIRNYIRPRWFILENVASMPWQDRDTISQALGVNPILIDASLVSAQSRKRLFWTNIPFTMPEDKGILLKDILQPDGEVDPSFTIDGKSFCLTSSYHKVGTGDKETEHNRKRKQRTMVKVGHIGATDGQANRVYDPNGKSVTLSANGGGSGAKTGLYAVGRDIGRRLTPDGTRADYDLSLPYERRVELRDDAKTGTLTSVQKDNLVVNTETHRIRKLTPIECERLQGLPDGYTDHVAKTHRYKTLGNAFNVDVVASILRGLQSTPSPQGL